MTSPSTRRLLKESTDIHKTPSPYFTASPISDTNLHDWHFTLTGPPSPTPYAHGLYHGRITFPPTYPLRPPSFRFLTPSGRFEVNREICLSISGHHEETWQPAWGVRTALLAIRSEIMGGESRGQVGGMEGSEAFRRECARESRAWVCTECAQGNNEEVMTRWWDYCREKGVDMDPDGCGNEQHAQAQTQAQDQTQPEINGTKETETRGGPTAQLGEVQAPVEGVPGHPSSEYTTAPAPLAFPASAVDSIQAPTSIAPSAPHVSAEGAESQSSSTSDQEAFAPSTSSPHLDETSRAAPSSPLVVAATTPVVVARRTQTAANVSEPANSPWLDRAIIGIVFALIILITKRVVNADDL
ncbi:Uncharacterized protein PECH_005447 [Penicillium ucsense]|uniref:UBC core domain-containing protein n=1 Tax=Penicillium ucsense TaxID=2839758 RepID=A0A8J8W4C8_9EURO|nr:Uncharacterized protein PECM_005985 [Penicillium ucsense]KAF7736346.1 Uncharacterized protein PECH_005447 [Penicillium ucsense]